jgi:hypothetical protein
VIRLIFVSAVLILMGCGDTSPTYVVTPQPTVAPGDNTAPGGNTVPTPGGNTVPTPTPTPGPYPQPRPDPVPVPNPDPIPSPDGFAAISRILQRSCLGSGCHSTPGASGVSLDSEAGFSRNFRQSLSQVKRGSMPIGRDRLTPNEIATLESFNASSGGGNTGGGNGGGGNTGGDDDDDDDDDDGDDD